MARLSWPLLDGEGAEEEDGQRAMHDGRMRWDVRGFWLWLLLLLLLRDILLGNVHLKREMGAHRRSPKE